MKIDILHIAKLAGLRIEEKQLLQVSQDMEEILEMVSRLPDVPDEMLLDAQASMELREDAAVTDQFTRSELLQNAPEVRSGCVVVPKTV